MNSTNCTADSVKTVMSGHELLGMSHLWILRIVPWVSLVLLSPHSHTYLTWLLVHALDGGKSKTLQIACEYLPKVSQIIQVWVKPRIYTPSITLRKAKMEAASNQDKACKLKNSATKGSNMCEVGMSFSFQGKSDKALKSLEG